MSQPTKIVFHSNAPQETQALAQDIAPLLACGDTILFEGDIGAGKSLFCRALIHARMAQLDQYEDVPSPTYTIVQTYDVGDTEIWHSDLYRLMDVSEITELGLEEAFETAICLVEWPDRLGDLAPGSALLVNIEMNEVEGHRKIVFSWTDPRWKKLNDTLMKACKT
jgi:tRNA threonylcarbamoyladenosine biosynthesis protein TsaE